MAVAPDIGALAALAVITFAILLLMAWAATGGAVINWLVNHIPRVSVTVLGRGVHDVFGWIRGPLQAFNNLVYHVLGSLIEADKAIWNKFVSWNAYAWHELSGTIADVADRAEQAFGYLVRHKIAALIAVTVGPLGLTVYALRKRIAALEAAAAHATTTVIRHVKGEVDNSKTFVRKVYKGASLAAVAALAHAIPQLWHGIDEAKDAAERALRRAERTVTKISPAVLAGVVLATLAKAGLSWIRCSNVARAGKTICGLDRGILEALIADTVLIAGTLSLVDFAEVMLAGMEEMSAGVLGGWRETAHIKPLKFTGYTGTLG